MIKLSDFDYCLPQGFIAQYPARERDASRLLLLDRKKNSVKHHSFSDITDFLRRGDLLILNDTKVMPARLIGRRATGGRVEVFILRELGGRRFNALIKPLGRLQNGEQIFFDSKFYCRLADAKNKIVEFNGVSAFEVMRKIGRVPLPPYIRRAPEVSDRKRYQTVFAKKEGAVAAPTAGLHFTRKLLEKIKKTGADIAFLTLHVSYGTFSPVRHEDASRHQVQEEYFYIPKRSVDLIRRAKARKNRIFAVGTTVTRALEDSWEKLLSDKFKACDISSWSRLFIYPPFDFKVIDAMITNFHLPRTTLLMLVCAFAGRKAILEAYNQAREENYRFYSYGDAMLIL